LPKVILTQLFISDVLSTHLT